MKRACASAAVSLLVLLGPVVSGETSRPTSAQDVVASATAAFLRFDDETARERLGGLTAQNGSRLMASALVGLTHLPHPFHGGTPAEGQAVLLSLGPSRDARLTAATTPADRWWLRLLEGAFGTEQGQPAWSELVQTAEAMGITGTVEARTSLLLTARFLVSAPAVGPMAPQPGALARAMAGLEELLAISTTDVDARHYLIRLYMRQGEAVQARRHARLLLSQQSDPRIAESALMALTAGGDWAAASDAFRPSADGQGVALSLPSSTRQLWHAYLLLQEGRMSEAESLLRPLWTIPVESALPARVTQARARALWVIETRRWMDARLAPTQTGMEADVVAGELLAAGMAGVRVGNQQQSIDALARMALLVGDGDQALPVVTAARPAPVPTRPGVNRPGVAPIPTSRPMRPGATGTANVSDDPAVIRLGIQRRRAAVMAQQLEAVSLFADGRRDEAIVLARQSAAVADDLPSDGLWPVPVKPAHELVGDLLLDARRPREAMTAYQDSLNRWPRRPLSLLGLYRAATMARDTEQAAAARALLSVVWARGDRSWSDIAEVLGSVKR